MNRSRIKICGIATPEAAQFAADAGADAIGLVFVKNSPRQISIEQAESIIRCLPAFVEPVCLFVDAPIDHVRQTAKRLGICTVQLHGKETPQYVRDLAPLRAIKAVAFDADKINATIQPWRDAADNLTAILVDAPPTVARETAAHGLPGGSGQTFDWNALAQAKSTGLFDRLPPLILAGGLTPQNVRNAIETVRPYGVDVSSGVESQRGVKDTELIRAFCRAVRGADSSH